MRRCFPARRGRLLQACQTVRPRTHPAAPPYPRNLFTSRRIFPDGTMNKIPPATQSVLLDEEHVGELALRQR